MEESKEYMNTTEVAFTTDHMEIEPSILNINNVPSTSRKKKRISMNEQEASEDFPTINHFTKYQSHDLHDHIQVFDQLFNRALRCSAYQPQIKDIINAIGDFTDENDRLQSKLDRHEARMATLAARDCALLDMEIAIDQMDFLLQTEVEAHQFADTVFHIHSARKLAIDQQRSRLRSNRIAYATDLAHANRLHPPDLEDPESVGAVSDVG